MREAQPSWLEAACVALVGDRLRRQQWVTACGGGCRAAWEGAGTSCGWGSLWFQDEQEVPEGWPPAENKRKKELLGHLI